VPSLACDAHFHVFGRVHEFPPVADALYPPPAAPLNAYTQLASRLGFERFVIVQPSVYGTDNRCTLQAVRALGAERCRAVIDVDERVTTVAELAHLHELGVRALRIHTHAYSADLIETWKRRLPRLSAMAGQLGWSLDFLMPGRFTEAFLPELQSIDVDFTIAHLGYLEAERGVTQPAFQNLLGLLRSGAGRCWIKLSGFYRMSRREDCEDVAPFVHSLIEAAPDRMLWGTDYPHVFVAREISTLRQFDLFGKWVTDDVVRRQILVTNPARLYGWPVQAS
jgi:predicted TIM-barrel fold metal-dependent hydrolase